MQNFNDVIEGEQELSEKTIQSDIPLNFFDLKSEYFDQRNHVVKDLLLKGSDAFGVDPNGRKISKKWPVYPQQLRGDREGISAAGDINFSYSVRTYLMLDNLPVTDLLPGGIENLQRVLKSQYPNFNFWLTRIVTENNQGQICTWGKTRTDKDHHIFNMCLQKLDGRKWKKYTEQQLVFAASELANPDKPLCKFEPRTLQTQTDQTACVS